MRSLFDRRGGGLSGRAHIGSIALILFACAALYWRCLSVGFVADDFDLFAAVSEPGVSGFQVFPAGGGKYFRPLVLLTLELERLLGGEGAAVHHAANLLVHGAVGALLYLVCFMLSGRALLSLGLALAAVCHPANVADVFWISGRGDSLCTLFLLLGIAGFLVWLLRGKTAWLVIAGAGFVGGILSKELGAVLPAIFLFLLVFLRLGGFGLRVGLRAAWIAVGCFLCCALGHAVFYFLVFYRGMPGESAVASPGGWLKVLLSAFFYVCLPFVRRHEVLGLVKENLGAVLCAGGAVVGAALVGAGWVLCRRGGWRELFRAGALAGMVAAALAPQALFLGAASERDMYLPIAAAAAAAAAWAGTRKRVGKNMLPVVVAAAGLFVVVSVERGGRWVENWRLAESCCRSFRSAAEGADGRTPLFLTYPYRVGDVPVFSNDVNGSLFHCLEGRFGYFAEGRWYGGIVALEEGAEVRRSVGTREASWEIRQHEGYFELSPWVLWGVKDPVAEVEVLSRTDYGEAAGFRARFREGADLSGFLLLEYRCGEFRRVEVR